MILLDSVTVFTIGVLIAVALFFLLEVYRRRTVPLIRVANLLFRGRPLHVDGYHFVNCMIVDCNLTTDDLNYQFEHCRIEASPLTTMFFGRKVALKPPRSDIDSLR